MGKLVEKREEFAAKQNALATIFAEAKLEDGSYDFKKSKDLEGDDATRLDAVRAKNVELEKLGAEVKALAELEDIDTALSKAVSESNQPTGGNIHPTGDGPVALKSLGEYIMGTGAHLRKGREIDFEVPAGANVKTLFETSAGWAPETLRTGKLVEAATRPVQVLDLIPSATTNQSAVVYMAETTYTSGAAEVAEGGAFAESTFVLSEVSSPVRKIATLLPITDEQLEDVAQAQAYVNNRLGFALRQRLDEQVLVGDGTAPNLSGILDRAGIQTQAKGADPTPDAIYKALTKVRVTGRATPNAVVLHSNDWQEIRLLRTADGVYIWGSPSEAGPASIWGLPVVLSEALTEGTGLVGDFAMHSQLSIRRNITVLVSNSHSDYFSKGKQAIRADLRASLEVFREAAFCSVTGI